MDDRETIGRATYSPEDNKLRIYPDARLDADTYARVKAAGFKWAAKQELFVAPMWTPGRADLCAELCGGIDDEDKTLVERAEDRAERFDGYSDKRARDADAAHRAVKAIAENIPFGQPILVGHHSEKRARRDAERIENGMRKAVSMWETSKYWEQRAAGALAAAKYKDKPGVRARRIKTLGAEMRKYERDSAEASKWLAAWSSEGLTIERAREIASYSGLNVGKNEKTGYYWSAWDVLRPAEERYTDCPAYTVAQVAEKAKQSYPRRIEHNARWINHYKNRIAYETALLNEQGAGALIEAKPRPKQLPICNYPEPVTIRGRYGNPAQTYTPHPMTKADYAASVRHGNTGTWKAADESHRVKVALIPAPEKPRYMWSYAPVFLTDAKITRPEAAQ